VFFAFFFIVTIVLLNTNTTAKQVILSKAVEEFISIHIKLTCSACTLLCVCVCYYDIKGWTIRKKTKEKAIVVIYLLSLRAM